MIRGGFTAADFSFYTKQVDIKTVKTNLIDIS
jgi:hypothetical protein